MTDTRTDMSEDRRRFSPPAARNRGPILDVLRQVLPAEARVLEIASGSGEHAVHFAKAMPRWRWRPSDPDADARASITDWIAAERLSNVLAPINIDVRAPLWGVEDDAPFDAIIACNMIHIAPWESALGLIAGAGRLLRESGVLVLYGPFMRDGVHTAPSNGAFDHSLKARDASWGVRDVVDVSAAAAEQGFASRQEFAMPANNLTLVFARATKR